jgi:hypothetical protein
VVLAFPSKIAWKNPHMKKCMVSFSGSTQSKDEELQSMAPCVPPSKPIFFMKLWDLNMSSILPLHSWINSSINLSSSLAWIIGILLGGWQYMKSQVTLNSLNQKFLSKFWKLLYSTWCSPSSIFCLKVCTLYGGINYVTHSPHSKSKCKTRRTDCITNHVRFWYC